MVDECNLDLQLFLFLNGLCNTKKLNIFVQFNNLLCEFLFC
jgi:hypothetical protein